VDFSFLVVPGTVVVFAATWTYMATAPPKESSAEDQLSSMPTDEKAPTRPSSWRAAVAIFTPWGAGAHWGLLATACTVVGIIAGLNTWDIGTLQDRPPSHGSHLTPVQSSDEASPFAQTVGFVRWNAPYLERIPLIEKYEPFFKSIHYSIPTYPNEDATFLNLTHSSWDNHENVYVSVAQFMSLILSSSEESHSSISGILYFHFDAWIDPIEFTHQDFSRIWYPDSANPSHSCFDNKHGASGWPWWNSHNLWDTGIKVLDSLNDTKYIFSKIEVCIGWSDIYYIPRRYFEDFVYLTDKFDPMFHEAAIPTMLSLIDQTYRERESARQVIQLSDCWGDCCADNPSREDILFHRCGHKLNYLDANMSIPHYEKLERQASQLGHRSSRRAVSERSIPLLAT
jgi:hypothetical protein